MSVHASAGGVSPLPTNCNDHVISKLQVAYQPTPASVTPASQDTEVIQRAPLAEVFSTPIDCRLASGKVQQDAEAQCGDCHVFFDMNQGYVGPGGRGFYCDDCVWMLAENGEFYCG
jgi:hypothetical protein